MPVKPEQSRLKDQIKLVATELLIRHGYRGVSFGDIAPLLETTRANIHYHFGNKQQLVEEVLEEYVDGTLMQFKAIWTEETSSFTEKINANISFNRRRYLKYNTKKDNRHFWSLITSLRSDGDVTGDTVSRTLQRFTEELSIYINKAISMAIKNGELVPATPVDDITIQLVSIANSAGAITQASGNFESLEHLYTAFKNTVHAAYGQSSW